MESKLTTGQPQENVDTTEFGKKDGYVSCNQILTVQTLSTNTLSELKQLSLITLFPTEAILSSSTQNGTGTLFANTATISKQQNLTGVSDACA